MPFIKHVIDIKHVIEKLSADFVSRMRSLSEF
jgi:hypothetical protein